MLRDLSIRDMLIIDRLDLVFEPGLNVLTGETGAGKSILLDSLGFVLGWRGRADLVRMGAEQGEVAAVFDLREGHPVHNVLEDAGLPSGPELFLRRVNTKDGRKTAYVNDRRCSGEILRQISDHLVELHGQNDDRGLLNAKGHQVLLDLYGQIDLGKLRQAWRNRQSTIKDLEQAKEALANVEKDAEFLRHSAKEIADLGPSRGEDVQLDTQRRLMQASEKIKEDIGLALNATGPQGAEAPLHDAIRWLQGVADQAEGRLDSALSHLSNALTELGNAQIGIGDFLDALSFDPHELENIEERLFTLRALARKHDVLPDELSDLGEEFAKKVVALDMGSEHLEELQSAVEKAQAEYDALAQHITDTRKKASAALENDMAKELGPLKLDRAVFTVELGEQESGPAGKDSVQFMIATNPGAPAGALNKVASGGELSRLLLALKVCLTKAQGNITMIFDEIDRGVGGATADAVGERLAEIANGGQVLVVTHSPQVAAKASHHWTVSKAVEDGRTSSTVIKMDHGARVDEIARMLAGDTITDQARAAAVALMDP